MADSTCLWQYSKPTSSFLCQYMLDTGSPCLLYNQLPSLQSNSIYSFNRPQKGPSLVPTNQPFTCCPHPQFCFFLPELPTAPFGSGPPVSWPVFSMPKLMMMVECLGSPKAGDIKRGQSTLGIQLDEEKKPFASLCLFVSCWPQSSSCLI